MEGFQVDSGLGSMIFGISVKNYVYTSPWNHVGVRRSKSHFFASENFWLWMNLASLFRTRSPSPKWNTFSLRVFEGIFSCFDVKFSLNEPLVDRVTHESRLRYLAHMLPMLVAYFCIFYSLGHAFLQLLATIFGLLFCPFFTYGLTLRRCISGIWSAFFVLFFRACFWRSSMHVRMLFFSFFDVSALGWSGFLYKLLSTNLHLGRLPAC